MNAFQFRPGKLVRGLAFAALLCGCNAADTPTVPTAKRSDVGDGVMRFPVANDGTLDSSLVAAIAFDEPAFNFGYVDEGAVVTHRFRFRNTGAQPLVITSARSTCGCTVPVYPKTPIAVGDTSSVLVRFDTNGKVGQQTKPVTLTANTYPLESVVKLVGQVDSK